MLLIWWSNSRGGTRYKRMLLTSCAGHLASNTFVRGRETRYKYFSNTVYCNTASSHRNFNIIWHSVCRFMDLNFSSQPYGWCSQFPELSPVVYGGGQSRNTYQGHGVSSHLASRKPFWLFIELVEHGGDVTGMPSFFFVCLITDPHNDKQGSTHKSPASPSITSV